MSNTIVKPYIPFITEVKEAAYVLPCSTYKVYDFIASEIFRWKDSRVTLEKELACSFIAKRINLSVSSVSRAIKKLVSMGYIEVIKEGVKGIGSIIKLTCKSAQMSCKNAKNTPSKMQENKETIYIKKENKQQSVEVVLLNKNINSNLNSGGNTVSDFTGHKHNENSSLISPLEERENEQVYICPEKITIFGREVNNTVGISDTIKDSQSVSHPLPKEEFKELSSVASTVGIKPSLFSTGIKALASRNCHNLKTTLQDILSQINGRVSTIKNKAAYFVSLCQNVELEDPPVPSTIEDNNSDDNNGFRRPPAWMTGEDELHPGELHQVEPPPVDLLQQKKKTFAEKISNYFTIGRVKYVLSPAGLPQKIIACSPDSFSYVKDGHMKHVSWGSLPEKLLNDAWFVGENE